MKLMLGTAQFGLPYGEFNATGQVRLDKVRVMLNAAAEAGIGLLDTARVYGESEAILARADAPARFNIVSKCPDLRTADDPVAALNAAFEASCTTLEVTKLYGYLLHNAEDIKRPGIWPSLCALRDGGRVEKIGVSGYDIGTVASLCARYPLTLVQLPANVLDAWYERVALPQTLELHVRSAFLQGFLLGDPAALPAHLARWRAVVEQFQGEAKAQGLTPLQAALAPLLNSPRVARVIVGADSPEQLDDILRAAWELETRSTPVLGPFKGVTPDLTDPRRWRSVP